jgi:hypothetical protein
MRACSWPGGAPAGIGTAMISLPAVKPVLKATHTVFVASRAACKWVGGAVVVHRLVDPVRKESVSMS